MKKNILCLLFAVFISLILTGCAAKNSLSPKKLSQNEQRDYKSLKEAGATKEELEKYILYHLIPTSESAKESFWREFWDKRYKTLTSKEKTIYHTYLSDSLSRIKYLSLEDERAREKFCGDMLEKKKNELIKAEEGKILYFSMKLVLSEEEMEEFLMIPLSEREEWIKRWWKNKDPDLITKVNELKEKFDQRVRFVRDFYGTIFGEKPWDDRGDIYILYGEPNSTEQADFYFDSPNTFISLRGGAVDQLIEDMISRSCVWFYSQHGFFQFQDCHATGDWELVPYKKNKMDENLRALTDYFKTVKETEAAKADVKYDFGKTLGFAGDLWKFWNEGDTYELKVNLGIPLKKLGVLPITDSLGREMSQFIFRVNMAILDKTSMRTISQDNAIIANQLPKNLNRDDLLLVDQFSWDSLPPGDYIISVSIKDSISQKIGIYRDTAILVPHTYATAQQKISYLIMTDPIWVADSVYTANGGKFIRNNLVIKPRPGNVFIRGQLAGYYCELYELTKGKNDSLSALVIYNILYQKTGKDSIAFYAAPESTLVNWPSDSQPFLMGTLTTSKFLPGYYVLHIVVYDLNDNPKSKPREAVVGFRIS